VSRILITGAAGFIGSRLLRVLQTQYEVFGLVRKLPAKDCLGGVHWIEQDLAEPFDYSRFPERVDVIIHLAQSRSYKQFPEGAKDIFHVNIKSTFNLLEYGRHVGAECFMLASTGGVYGHSYERFAETDPVSPLDFYLTSKFASELLIANYRKFFRTVVFRFFFVYGPGQKGMLVPRLMEKVKKSETILVEGNPGVRINPIFVEDAVRVFEAGLHLATSDLFNVAGDEVVTITELVRLIGEVVGKEPVIDYKDVKTEGNLVGDNRRMKEMLGVFPRTRMRDGLRLML